MNGFKVVGIPFPEFYALGMSPFLEVATFQNDTLTPYAVDHKL